MASRTSSLVSFANCSRISSGVFGFSHKLSRIDLIKSLKTHGVAVIIISHRMDDIFYACDRVMALYQGTNFAESPLATTTRNEVIGWIMGTKGHTDSLAHDKVH